MQRLNWYFLVFLGVSLAASDSVRVEASSPAELTSRVSNGSKLIVPLSLSGDECIPHGDFPRLRHWCETPDVVSTPKFEVQELETDLVVARRDVLAEGVVALSLEDPTGPPLPGWTPGAHIDLVPNTSLVRQYSLCGSPTDMGTWRIAVLRDPQSRGGSDFVHDKLHVGSLGAHPRPAKPLSVGERAALPVHRRRDRDHADARR